MNFVEIAGISINLDHVVFIREEDHAQLGQVIAIHFAHPERDPLRLSAEHYDELRRLLQAPVGKT
ncbi:hypothetical protein CRI94_13075 [Longibacter salinarum]|uniref:Uncharacterized protein n=1 Tax=Longibacter salinarum TaxID=1850348 RepID=A0A2A8CVZ8_9BACT|nr:hypothetical protein [Longibacter salinarum]PEN12929.1 hypothetical protein CRI94_13075 [Longibacter salinarum]